ncbi:FAR-17a/AIG1-like protein [Cokeromyces recurvatus]|uniref:FAR-17a/AIG1-like protein n=1 Tax=Cokeromyces recurvatus TaxID=90255 RepID=UPI002220989F|nr:FAR-17a/AIG1-like protein [Cokeromyces recurvatus]KAI7899693.1 FAR-17a/AIG1-like protein [Cokeromyces recurvatus]
MTQRLNLVLNTIGFLSNVYALRNMNTGPFENHYALGFGGQYQYLTILGLTIATIAFTLKIIRYFIPKFSTVIYEIITNIATPLEGLISVLYWSMMLLDPHLLIPKDLPGIPLILDCTLHLFPAVFLWIDFLAFDIDFKRSNTHVGMISAFTLFYFAWSWYCQHVNGYWAYPFLAEFTLFMRIGFFVGSGLLCWGMYEIGAKIHDKIHTSHDKAKKKLTEKSL